MKRFKNILYISKGNIDTISTMTRAVTLAENNQADLTVIEVIPAIPANTENRGGDTISTDLQAVIVTKHRRYLESLIKSHQQRLNIKHEVMMGATFLEIIRAVLRHGYDLVIKPVENTGLLERLFGGDDIHLLRKCPCPVWLIKPREKQSYGNILAAIDFNPHETRDETQNLNQQIIELSASLALSDFATLHLAHAWETVAEGKIQAWSRNRVAAVASYIEGERLSHESGLYQLGEYLRKQLGNEAYDYLAPRFHLRKGHVGKAITELTAELQIDLLVIGTVARTGIAGLLIGNTAETILKQANCSMLVLKPSDFVSPISLAK